jgi:hypothetical protein
MPATPVTEYLAARDECPGQASFGSGPEAEGALDGHIRDEHC